MGQAILAGWGLLTVLAWAGRRTRRRRPTAGSFADSSAAGQLRDRAGAEL